MHGTNFMYTDMLCACVNAPRKGQHVLLGALALLLCSSPPSCSPPHRLADGPYSRRGSTPAQRLSRLDIAGHRRIRGGGNWSSPPALLFLTRWGFSAFTLFFFCLVFSQPPAAVPNRPPIPSSLKIKFTRLHGVWLVLRLNLASWDRIKDPPDIGLGHLLKEGATKALSVI